MSRWTVFFRSILKKIVHRVTSLKDTIKKLIHSNTLPTAESALFCLQKYHPNPGNSCWKENDVGNKTRSCMLSVIIPAYNVEKYIEACLESVLNQDVSFSYEIIVVNDGSTDRTPWILKKYESNNKVKIIHQTNQSLSVARNTGIEYARGEYLCFVDSDDEIAENSLAVLMNVVLEHQAMLVVDSYSQCLRNGTVLYSKLLPDQKAEGISLPGYAWANVFHHSVFDNLRFPEGYWFEDSIMAQIVHPMCVQSTYTSSYVCYKYYVNENGITSSAKNNIKSIDSLWITMQLLEDMKKFNLSYTQSSYEHFLSMVNLTYHRTKCLSVEVAQYIFVIQKMLMDCYYDGFKTQSGRRYQLIENALCESDFKKYVLACELSIKRK